MLCDDCSNMHQAPLFIVDAAGSMINYFRLIVIVAIILYVPTKAILIDSKFTEMTWAKLLDNTVGGLAGCQ